jgi:putative membrane protein
LLESARRAAAGACTRVDPRRNAAQARHVQLRSPARKSVASHVRRAPARDAAHALAPQSGNDSNPRPPVMKLIVRWLLLAAALLLVAHLSPGVTVNSFGAALVAALVLGLLNTLVRPLLVLLTLPVTVLTLGLFLFVINALMFWSAAGLLDGFRVNGFGSALIGSVIYSIASTIIDVAIEHLFEE